MSESIRLWGNWIPLLDYPLYEQIINVFIRKIPIARLRDQYIKQSALFNSMEVLGTFIDNHDKSRFLSMIT